MEYRVSSYVRFCSCGHFSEGVGAARWCGKMNHLNWSGVYVNDGGKVVRQQHETVKAVTDGRLLTFNVLIGQQLSLLETSNFRRKQTNLAFDV